MKHFDDVVRRMDVSSLSGDFASPYTFRERDFFVCEYAMADGRLLYTKGALAAAFGVEMPQQLQNLCDACDQWPITPEYKRSAAAYFDKLQHQPAQPDGAPSLYEMRMVADGEESWVCLSSTTAQHDGEYTLQLRFMRVDNEKQVLARLVDRSETDPLTHTLNRNGLVHAMEELASQGKPYAFVMLDIDGFKRFNDVYGHLAGDALLTNIVDRLTEGLQPGDLLARVGGDEFIICLYYEEENQSVQRMVRHVHKTVLEDSPGGLQLSASLGVALCPKNGTTFEELYRKADVAMFCAKRRGGNDCLFYEENMVMPGPEEGEHRPESSQQHLLVRYDPATKRFAYPPEMREVFGAAFDGRCLWDVLDEEGIARTETIQRLQADFARICCEAGVGFSEYLLKHASGMWRWYRIGIISAGALQETAITITDVNEQLHTARQFKHMTEYDELTGLLSHSAFVRRVERLLKENAAAAQNGEYAMIYFDILRFKAINDRFGVSEGDRLLTYIANGLSTHSGQDEAVCRIGSDQFAVFLHRNGEKLEKFIKKYLQALEQYDLSYEIVSNVGVYIITDASLSVDAMLDRAILAQSSIKGSYVTKFSYYSEEMRNAMLGEQEIVGMMNTALAERQFVVYYQPQYDHSTGELVGAEALVRWLHPEHGLISPGVFIPIFEKNGFITRLDFFVFDQVCRFQRNCLNEGRGTVPISVNLTRDDIFQPDFVEQLEKIRQMHQVPVELVCIEITETAVVGDNRHASKVIQQLHQRGYVVEMDDFGSGYSSLNVLKDIDLDILKLDMRFLTTAMAASRSGTILSSIVRMAKWLSLPVIAEGVESLQQADYLKSIGCNYIQGFLYARPMPEGDFYTLLNRSTIGETRPSMRLIDTLSPEDFWNPESQETLIFSNYVGGAAIYDYHGGQLEMLRVNPKYLQEIGGVLNEQQLIGKNSLDMFDNANRQLYVDMLERAIASGGEEESETWRCYSDSPGECVCIRSSVRVIGHSKDNYLFYEMIRNITREKSAVTELMNREKLFRAASEQVNIYYWVYDVPTREMTPCFRCMRDLGLPCLVTNYPEPAIEMGIFPQDVADQYREMHKQIENGVKELEAIMPLTAARAMFRVRYTTEFDASGKPVRAYGSAVPV